MILFAVLSPSALADDNGDACRAEIAALQDYAADEQNSYDALCSTAELFNANRSTCDSIISSINSAYRQIGELSMQCP